MKQIHDKYLEIDTSNFNYKKREAENEELKKKVVKDLRTFINSEGYNLSKDDSLGSGNTYRLKSGFFSFSKAKISINEANEYGYYIIVSVKKKNLRLIKSLFEDFSLQNKIKVKVNIEWSDYDWENKEEEETK